MKKSFISILLSALILGMSSGIYAQANSPRFSLSGESAKKTLSLKERDYRETKQGSESAPGTFSASSTFAVRNCTFAKSAYSMRPSGAGPAAAGFAAGAENAAPSAACFFSIRGNSGPGSATSRPAGKLPNERSSSSVPGPAATRRWPSPTSARWPAW